MEIQGVNEFVIEWAVSAQTADDLPVLGFDGIFNFTSSPACR
jgi:hypothetical protein